MNSILDEIKKRKSPMVFSDRKIEKEKIESVIEAARWAPSCFNNQPWNYIFVGKNDSTRKDLENSLMIGNGWAKKSPYIVVVGADPEKDCKMNGIDYFTYDTGLSVMNAVIEAEHQGLRVHQMAGWDAKKAKKAVGFPDNYKVIVIFAIGYEGDVKKVWDKLTEKIKDRMAKPRERKEPKENFFFGKFSKK